jgi:hypothetical protein
MVTPRIDAFIRLIRMNFSAGIYPTEEAIAPRPPYGGGLTARFGDRLRLRVVTTGLLTIEKSDSMPIGQRIGVMVDRYERDWGGARDLE